VRRGLNLISADDLFESFEFDLRKNSQLTDTFIAYDYLFNRVIPTLGQPDTLYAKMMLRALLLLSLAKLPATILDLASAVMLYDEREPQGFIQRLTNIMQQLRQNHPAIVAEESEAGPCYYFQTVPLNSNDPLPIRDTTPSTTLTPSVQEAFISQAATINDQDPRLADLLITYGRKYFQDWPFYQDANGKLHDRAEINLKWRGSLRRGIIKWGGDYEAKLNTGIKQSEYDWQIILLPPINAKPPSVLPDSSTLLYWHPHILSDSETSIFKYLLILQQQGTTLFSNPAELAKIVQPLEARAEEIFTRIYLDEGHFFSGRGKTLPAKATSTLLNIFLTTKLNDGLSQLYPLHPQFEELLLPDYINDLASWMFASDRLPTLQQQLYLEKFARPLELIIGSGNNYQLNTQFLPNSPAGRLLQLITSASSPVSKLQAYALLRNEPLGLQLPALLLLLAALAASGKVTLAKDTGEPLHGPKGLYANCELSDFGWIYSAHSSPLPLSVPPPPPAAPMPAVVSKTNYIYTVLIVSPQASILQQLTEACGDLGCRLELVATGQEALQKMDATTSLVIADLQLPDTDAVDLFKQLQTNPLQRDIPFIVLTEVNQGDELARVLESGIEDFWLKPLQIPEIKIRLKRVLRRNLTRTSAYAAIAWPVSHLANSNTPTTGSPMLSTSLPSNASLPLLPDLLVSPPIIPEKVLETPHITSPAISSAPIRFTTTMEVNPSNLPFIDVEPESLAEAQLINAELISAELSPIAFDRLAIPSVMAETQSTNDAAPLFPNFTVEEEISPRRAVPNIEIPQFTISITSSETDSLPILQLYNQFWDTCRRVGNPKTIPEYEEFCQLIATHLKQWPAPVLIDEGIIFSVDVENNQAYVNYYLHNNVDKLNPKQFRLL
jgi:CheY-like chemotaxis protein